MDNASPDPRQALRALLIDAASRAIAEKGYAAVRARDLAAEVGCAVGSIYNVFPDIDALILAVKEKTLDGLETELIGRLGPFEPGGQQAAAERFLALGQEYVRFSHDHWRLWSQAFEHTAQISPAYDAYMLRLDAILTNIEQPLASLLPALAADRRRLMARALFASVHGIVSLGLGGKLGPITLEQLQWQVRAILSATLKGMQD